MRRLLTLFQLLRARDWKQLALVLRTQLVPKFLFYRYEIVFVRMDAVRVPALDLDHIRTRPATPADLGLLQQVKARGDEFAGAFAAGDAGFLALCGDRPAAYMWLEKGGLHRSPVNLYDFDLGRSGLWSYGVEVHPDFRMRGALVKMWADAVASLRPEFDGPIYAGIPRDNELSVKSHTRLGFELLYYYRVTRLCGVGWHTLEFPDGSRATRFGWHHGHASTSTRTRG